MDTTNNFPFGQPVRNVIQTNCSSKDVFVLGVYSSAVHARWIGKNNRTIITALAVDNEPYIFWRGDNADDIIQQIAVPEEVGKLVPANPQFNGPSGIALDELILSPIGVKRENAWLCDLVPHSCVNPAQQAAIQRAYIEIANQYHLPFPSVPSVPSHLTDEKRRKEILGELFDSKAEVLVLLGDKPIQWFLKFFDNRWSRLADFGSESGEYGKLHTAMIDGKEFTILPLAHPRQIARLGSSSELWFKVHEEWIQHSADKLFAF